MRIEAFRDRSEMDEKTEIEKVAALAFFLLEEKKEMEFSVKDVCSIIFSIGFAKPNMSRLDRKIRSSPLFVKGGQSGFYRLSVRAVNRLRDEFHWLSDDDEIITDDSVVPEVLFVRAKREYLLRAVKQINSSYENNLYDACALIMRRLLEVMLIHCFEEKGVIEEIKESDGGFVNLRTLIIKAKSAKEVNLSKEAKKDIDGFRELGNLSAHRMRYSCRASDIKEIKMRYRVLMEELLHISGLLS